MVVVVVVVWTQWRAYLPPTYLFTFLGRLTVGRVRSRRLQPLSDSPPPFWLTCQFLALQWLVLVSVCSVVLFGSWPVGVSVLVLAGWVVRFGLGLVGCPFWSWPVRFGLGLFGFLAYYHLLSFLLTPQSKGCLAVDSASGPPSMSASTCKTSVRLLPVVAVPMAPCRSSWRLSIGVRLYVCGSPTASVGPGVPLQRRTLGYWRR